MEELDIFQEVMQRFHQKKTIEDEMLFYILDTMSERFVESHDDSKWQCYSHMLDKLNKVWQYKQFEGISSEQSYLYGAIWGSLSMLSSIKEKKVTSQKCHTLAMKYDTDSEYIFLKSILDSPGIQNKKLAGLCDVTNARVSQIASKALKDGLISTQIFGKEKCYYIRTLGESVHDIIRNHRKQFVENPKSFDYKMISFSNEEDDFWIKSMKLNSALDSLNKQYKVGIAVAIGQKQERIQSKDMYELENVRRNMICQQEMSNLFKSFKDSWGVPKEIDMINQL
ncbi:hypothetical protein [Methanobrevibacter sp.]|uniref:hypothetical protein n=1 Tax=Methanobrevibacter sp. TaxID=66852 RepID=UPI00386A7130